MGINELLAQLMTGGNPFEQRQTALQPLPMNLPVQSLIQSLLQPPSQPQPLQAPSLSPIQSLIRPLTKFEDPLEALQRRLAEENQQPDPFDPILAELQRKLAETPEDISKGAKILYGIGAGLGALGGNQAAVQANLGTMQRERERIFGKREGLEQTIFQTKNQQAQRKAIQIERQNTQLVEVEQTKIKYGMAMAQNDQANNDRITSIWLEKDLDRQNILTRGALEKEREEARRQDAFQAGRANYLNLYATLTGNSAMAADMANRIMLGVPLTQEQNAALDKGLAENRRLEELKATGPYKAQTPLNRYNYEQVLELAKKYPPGRAVASEIEKTGRVSYDPEIQQEAAKNAARTGVPEEIILEVIRQESGFNKKASSGKAYGIAQFTPATASRFGLDGERLKNDPAYREATWREQIRAQADYLKELSVMFNGDEELMLAAYNAGENAVKEYGNKIPPYKETQNFVKSILGNVVAIRGMNVRNPEYSESEKLGFAAAQQEAQRKWETLKQNAEDLKTFMKEWRQAGDTAYQNAKKNGVPIKYGEAGGPAPPKPELIGTNVPNPMATVQPDKPFLMRDATPEEALREAIMAQRMKATKDGFDPDLVDAFARSSAGPLAFNPQTQEPQGIKAKIDAALASKSPEEVLKEAQESVTLTPEEKKFAEEYIAPKIGKKNPAAEVFKPKEKSAFFTFSSNIAETGKQKAEEYKQSFNEQAAINRGRFEEAWKTAPFAAKEKKAEISPFTPIWKLTKEQKEERERMRKERQKKTLDQIGAFFNDIFGYE